MENTILISGKNFIPEKRFNSTINSWLSFRITPRSESNEIFLLETTLYNFSGKRSLGRQRDTLQELICTVFINLLKLEREKGLYPELENFSESDLRRIFDPHFVKFWRENRRINENCSTLSLYGNPTIYSWYKGIENFDYNDTRLAFNKFILMVMNLSSIHQ